MKKSLVLLFSPIVALGCSKPAPHLGETTVVASEPGISIVQQESRSILPSGGLAGSEAIAVRVEARVDAIDRAKRDLTLTDSEGKTETFRVSPEVRNFDQIRTGDYVRIAYKRLVTFEVREPTPEEIKVSGMSVQSTARARAGELPAAQQSKSTVQVVTIESINKAQEQLTVRRSDGITATLQAKYPENLSHVKPGQKAVVTEVESTVASIDRMN